MQMHELTGNFFLIKKEKCSGDSVATADATRQTATCADAIAGRFRVAFVASSGA